VFMAEQVLDGKLVFNHEKNYKQIVKPEGSIQLVEAIAEITSEPVGLKVSNYQEN
jgi:hypothetical protein